MGTLAEPPVLPARLVTPIRTAVRSGIKIGLVAGIGMALTDIACQYLQVGPVTLPPGVDFLMYVGKILIMLVTLPLLCVPFFGWFFLPFKATRPRAIVYILSSLIPFVMLCGAFEVSERLRTRAFTAVTERAQPLVDAIHAYEKANGSAPPSLQALVPKYLDKIPGTGMASSPHFDYASEGLKHRPTGSWYLGFDTTDVGMLDFDAFIYEPVRDGMSADGERFGDWVYLHD